MSFDRIALLLALGVIIVIGLLSSIGDPRPIQVLADHDLPPTSHLSEGTDPAHGRLVANVIVGISIPVCSDDYPRSAGYAALRWNTFFSFRQVFRVRDDNTAVPLDDPASSHNGGSEVTLTATWNDASNSVRESRFGNGNAGKSPNIDLIRGSIRGSSVIRLIGRSFADPTGPAGRTPQSAGLPGSH